jgi:hypothetical protein
MMIVNERRREMGTRNSFVGRGIRAVFLWATVLSSGVLFSQEVIKNPGKPSAANAGRVLKLEEIWRVTDEGGAFYFKYPYRLRIAPDGTIFLQDEAELLKFTAGGTFIRNLFKKGEGPGEMSAHFGYQLDGSDLLIYDGGLRRLWRADLDGKWLGEIPLNKKINRGFVGVGRDGLVFSREDAPAAPAGIPGFSDFPQMIILLTRDGKSEKDIAPFFFKRYLISGGGLNWGNAIKTMSEDGRLVFGFHGRDYLIEVLDLDRGKIVRRFRRDYPHVPQLETKDEREWREKMKLPKADYKTDIDDLKPNGPLLWVSTSTEDPEKGKLWDVFDAEGRYVDCFYLGAGRELLRASGDVVFVLEKNPDETLRLVKYRIAD